MEVQPKRLLDFLRIAHHPTWIHIYHSTKKFLEEYGNLKTYNQVGQFVINLLEAMLDRSGSTVLNMESPFKVFCDECDAFAHQTFKYSTTCFPIPAVQTLFDFWNSYLVPEDREDYGSALTIKIEDSPETLSISSEEESTPATDKLPSTERSKRRRSCSPVSGVICTSYTSVHGQEDTASVMPSKGSALNDEHNVPTTSTTSLKSTGTTSWNIFCDNHGDCSIVRSRDPPSYSHVLKMELWTKENWNKSPISDRWQRSQIRMCVPLGIVGEKTSMDLVLQLKEKILKNLFELCPDTKMHKFRKY